MAMFCCSERLPIPQDDFNLAARPGPAEQEAGSSSPTSIVVFSIALNDLPGANLDPSGTPCRVRLLDVSAFLDASELRIVEYNDHNLEDPLADISQTSIPPYTTISYPWRDLQLPKGQYAPCFSVAGAEHADHISIDVLKTVCIAAQAYGLRMLWLDRLCILQNYEADKIWHIRRWYRIFQQSALCLVVPGGLVRLARLDELTGWIHRAWTLQEAVAPGLDRIRLVIQFTHPSYTAYLKERCAIEGYNEALRHFLVPPVKVHQPLDKILEEGRTATCDMSCLMMSLWAIAGAICLYSPSTASNCAKLPIRILPPAEAQILANAMTFGGLRLWVAAYTRSSSRPIDMAFVLMNLFGVQIDVARFREDDRLEALIAIIQALMKRPHATATWLFIAPSMTPSRELSTLPEIPQTSKDGRAYVRTSGGHILASASEYFHGGPDKFVCCIGAPTGTMTNSGYFVFWAKAALLLYGTKMYDDRETWAVVVGRFRNYHRNPDTWQLQGCNHDWPSREGCFELTLMFIERHGYDVYHRVGMETEVDERKTAGWQWRYRRFQVGGPGRGERKRFSLSPSGIRSESTR